MPLWAPLLTEIEVLLEKTASKKNKTEGPWEKTASMQYIYKVNKKRTNKAPEPESWIVQNYYSPITIQLSETVDKARSFMAKTAMLVFFLSLWHIARD